MTKRISDLLDTYSDPNIELQIKMPLSSERIKELTMKKINIKQKHKKNYFRGRIIIVAAVLTAFVMTAFAAGNSAEWFKTFFEVRSDKNLTEEQLAFIESNAVTVAQGKTINGYTVMLDSYLNDGSTLYAKIRIQAPENKYLPKGAFYMYDLCKGGSNFFQSRLCGSSQWRLIADASNEKTYLLTYTAEQGRSLEGATLVLWDLIAYGEGDNADILLAEGTWEFDLLTPDAQELHLLKSPVSGVMATNSNGEVEVTLSAAVLRAMGLQVQVDMTEELSFTNVEIAYAKAVMKDGSEEILNYSGNSELRENGELICWHYFDVDGILNLDDVLYLEFPDGTQIPVA